MQVWVQDITFMYLVDTYVTCHIHSDLQEEEEISQHANR